MFLEGEDRTKLSQIAHHIVVFSAKTLLKEENIQYDVMKSINMKILEENLGSPLGTKPKF